MIDFLCCTSVSFLRWFQPLGQVRGSHDKSLRLTLRLLLTVYVQVILRALYRRMKKRKGKEQLTTHNKFPYRIILANYKNKSFAQAKKPRQPYFLISGSRKSGGRAYFCQYESRKKHIFFVSTLLHCSRCNVILYDSAAVVFIINY